MSDIVEQLRNIRSHLASGRFGQREVWEEQLEKAATVIERQRTEIEQLQAMLVARDKGGGRRDRAVGKSRRD